MNMRCLMGIMTVMIVLIVLVLFDWLNARVWILEGLSALQQGVEVLAEWGDTLQGQAAQTEGVMEQAEEIVDTLKPAVEKISE